jgi:hypothetical protein
LMMRSAAQDAVSEAKRIALKGGAL